MAEAVADDAAAILRDAIARRGAACLAVSGGATPAHYLPALSARILPWDKVTVTLTDERWALPHEADSNEGLIRRCLLHGPASAVRFIGLRGTAATPLAAAADACARLADLPDFDCVLLGLGGDGHFASVFPGRVAACDVAAACVATIGPNGARLTLTPRRLLAARRLLLIHTGRAKQAVLDAARGDGPIEDLPIRLVLRRMGSDLRIFRCDG